MNMQSLVSSLSAGDCLVHRLRKNSFLTGAQDSHLQRVTKLVKCYIWSIALHGAEIWTLRAVDQKHLESFEGAGGGWKRSVGLIM